MTTLRYILAVVAWLAVSLAASGQEMPADTVAWPDSTVHLNKFQQFKERIRVRIDEKLNEPYDTIRDSGY